MIFKRDLYKVNGCLEYSWVSEGKRRVIQLNPNVKEGEGDGPMAKDASHVQVYALSNGLYGLKEWQFPSGPPYPSPIVRAIVDVKETEAVGTVFYQDQSSATDTKALVAMPVKCPTPADNVSRVDPKITDVDPPTVPRNTAVTITLIGLNFTKDSVVLIDDANPTTKFVSPSMLEAELDADDIATPGKRGIKVHGAKDGTTSNEVTLTVK
jgi:IPT/TIG domain